MTAPDRESTSVVQHRLDLPFARPPKALWGNTRVHWRQRSRDTRLVRETVLVVARSAGLHRLCDGRVKHVDVGLTWAPGDRRRRDADNLWPLMKVACDALARGPRRDWVGLEIVADDTPLFMTKRAPRIAGPPVLAGMWLDVVLTIRGE